MGVMCDERVTERDRSSQMRQLIIKLRTVSILFTLYVRFFGLFLSLSPVTNLPEAF